MCCAGADSTSTLPDVNKTCRFYSGQAIRDAIREQPEASSLSGLGTECSYFAFSSVAKVIFKHRGLLVYLHRIYFNYNVIFPFHIEENIFKTSNILCYSRI